MTLPAFVAAHSSANDGLTHITPIIVDLNRKKLRFAHQNLRILTHSDHPPPRGPRVDPLRRRIGAASAELPTLPAATRRSAVCAARRRREASGGVGDHRCFCWDFKALMKTWGILGFLDLELMNFGLFRVKYGI